MSRASIDPDFHYKEASAIINSVKSLFSSNHNISSNQLLSPQKRGELAVNLAKIMLQWANEIQTKEEKAQQIQLARMMKDPHGKAFTTALTDQCFRSNRPARVANQIRYVLNQFGIPKYLFWFKRVQLKIFYYFGTLFPNIFIPLTKMMLCKETSKVILPGEPKALAQHMEQRRNEHVRINLNHLGEAILGEEEAHKRLQIYLDDLANPNVEYISVKVSTIYSQINLLAWDHTLEVLTERLSSLYLAAQSNDYTYPDGTKAPKFVNLDMEEYRDLELTVTLFCKVLDLPEFFHHQAGIVLQSYLPDSFLYQQQLTQWALNRVERGGAPIKIRIVKGANLAMEKVEASLRGWEQAPYLFKKEVDANYKQMVNYGCHLKNAEAVHLGIASHNLFDIAYAILLIAENKIEPYVCFEMLEGMADHLRRVVQKITGDILLYCPAAKKEEFQHAVAYLIRRLDENTAPENFLRDLFDLNLGGSTWNKQVQLFLEACNASESVNNSPRRIQNRLNEHDNFKQNSNSEQFTNEPDTDWSLKVNREWVQKILLKWQSLTPFTIPLVINGTFITAETPAGKGSELSQEMNFKTQPNFAPGFDPSRPDTPLFYYTLATQEHINQALIIAKEAELNWGKSSIERRVGLLKNIAKLLRKNRGDLIGSMVANTGKSVTEADVEISEAIDFAEYYAYSLEDITSHTDIRWSPKGTVLVAPPWNFPCSIPAGGILAALATGNSVIFKPAPEAVLVGWILIQLFWKAGVSQDVLQFINCDDEPIGSELIRDPRLDCVVLTGGTATAKLLLKLRPGLDLLAETGGKNALIVTSMSDRDLAIKDIIQSAFGHAGQKCSACSLAICEKEVYHDPHFKQQLLDAATSWKVGSPWDLSTRMTPLIRSPNETLFKGLTELEDGEEWLLKPEQNQNNPNLWTPGIKWGVTEKSFSYSNELFGPVLSVMCAENLNHALKLASGTPYGLTAGIHTLDDREWKYWLKHVQAGNCYINRSITGAIVQRQPFGGWKESSFGPGAKAGGPNYLMQLMHAEQISWLEHGPELSPSENLLVYETCNPHELNESLKLLNNEIHLLNWTEGHLLIWHKSIESYSHYWCTYFSLEHDPSQLLGQDNILKYVPQDLVLVRLEGYHNKEGSGNGNGERNHFERDELDIWRVIAGAIVCGSQLCLSFNLDQKKLYEKLQNSLDKLKVNLNLKETSAVTLVLEETQPFLERVRSNKIKRVRLFDKPTMALREGLSELGCYEFICRPLANGRVELFRYLKEMSISIDYHRYGNLGLREPVSSV